jgi:hypothetical protein
MRNNIIISTMSIISILSIVGCSESHSTSPAPKVDEVVNWSIDISLGRGIKSLSKDTIISGSISGTITGKINKYSKEKFKDTLGFFSVVNAQSVKCAISDSGTFSFNGIDLIALQGYTNIRVWPTAKPGYKASPDMITIGFTNL